MNALTEEYAIFENDEWLVTGLGLEHKHTGYFIERDGIANRRSDGLWTWPMHMAEKNWCRMPAFMEAFFHAASAYRIEPDSDLARTFKITRCEVPESAQRNVPETPPHTLRKDVRIPISSKPIFLKKPMSNKGFSVSSESGRIRFRVAPHSVSRPARRQGFSLDWVKAALPWRAPHRIRRTGTTLVRLIQATWNIR